MRNFTFSKNIGKFTFIFFIFSVIFQNNSHGILGGRDLYNLDGLVIIGGCSGSVIGSRTILTAAHCFEKDDNFKIKGFKVFDKRGNSKYFEGQVVIHEKFNYGLWNALDHDIAIVRNVREKFSSGQYRNLSSFVTRIFKINNDPVQSGAPITIVGNGPNGKYYGNSKYRYGFNTIKTVSSMRISFDSPAWLSDPDELYFNDSAGYEGDSGGPAFPNNTTNFSCQIGVYSRIQPKYIFWKNKIHDYTNAASYYTWIKSWAMDSSVQTCNAFPSASGPTSNTSSDVFCGPEGGDCF